MIRDFWVENYYSIRDRQEMNFKVRRLKESTHTLEEFYSYLC